MRGVSLVVQCLRLLSPNTGGLGLIPGSGRCPGGGHGNPLQYSCLENPMDRGAWWAIVHDVAKNRTRLRTKHSTAQGTGSHVPQLRVCMSQLRVCMWHLEISRAATKTWRSQMLFSRQGVFGSLWPHGLLQARLPCPSPSPRVYPD